MANNVYTNISFYELSDAGKTRLEGILSRYDDGNLATIIDGFDQKEADYDWYITNVGSKWAYIEEHGDGYISIVSAWSPPMSAIEFLLQSVNEVDPEFVASVSYTDEMPNFAGVAVYAGGDSGVAEIDSAEWDGDEIIEEAVQQTGLNSEDEDFYSQMWDVLDTLRDDVVESAVQSLRN